MTLWPKNLRAALTQARAEKIALGHFNISDVVALRAVCQAAATVGLPVVIGLSEGERDFLGVQAARALVSSMAKESPVPIFLNADHTYSLERAQEAIDAGYDSVVIDGSKLSLEENIALTKQVVDYARRVRSEVLLEGEIGYIGTSSKLLDTIPEGVLLSGEGMPQVAMVKSFVEATGIDAVAPAVGNLHGMLKNSPSPRLAIDLISDIAQAVDVPVVLHGGSGISGDDFRSAIVAGIALIHINTEIRLAYRDALKKYLNDTPDEIAPYRFLAPGLEAMQKLVESRLRLFSQEGQK